MGSATAGLILTVAALALLLGSGSAGWLFILVPLALAASYGMWRVHGNGRADPEGRKTVR